METTWEEHKLETGERRQRTDWNDMLFSGDQSQIKRPTDYDVNVSDCGKLQPGSSHNRTVHCFYRYTT